MEKFEFPAALLQRMVRLDTVNAAHGGQLHSEAKLADFLERLAIDAGLTTRRFPVPGHADNLLITHQGATAKDAPWLLFESHMDTVGIAGMTIDPFGAMIDGNRMHGRGTCDTKGTGAAMFQALSAFHARAAKANVALLFTVDEEHRKTGIWRWATHDRPTLQWNITGAVVGEPTRMNIGSAHNGVVRWTVRTRGLAAHSSDPSRGKSAILDMIPVIQAVQSRYIAPLALTHPLTGKAQCSINMIKGGMQINIIPEQCEIQIDRRTLPGEDPNHVLPAVDSILAALRREHPSIVVEQDPPFIDPALDPGPAKAWIDHVATVNRSLGLPHVPIGFPFGTDASTLAHVGVPSVVMGPGDIAQAHTAHEWIDLDQLDLGVAAYLRLMESAEA